MKRWLEKLNTEPEIFRSYEYVLFRNCLRHNFLELRSVLPNTSLARLLHYVVNKKDILMKEKLEVRIRQWYLNILENWQEIIQASRPRLGIHMCKELSKIAGKNNRHLSSCRVLKDWYFDLLRQPIKNVDLNTKVRSFFDIF